MEQFVLVARWALESARMTDYCIHLHCFIMVQMLADPGAEIEEHAMLPLTPYCVLRLHQQNVT